MMKNPYAKSDKNLQAIRTEIEKGYEGDPVPFDAERIKKTGRAWKALIDKGDEDLGSLIEKITYNKNISWGYQNTTVSHGITDL